MSESWWLVFGDGARRRIDAGGVTLGRAPRSDVVLASERASRTHALIVLASEGPELVVLGRAATVVNGNAIEKERALASGDLIELPGLALTIERIERAGDDEESAVWILERSDGTLCGVARSPFRIGGGDDDELRLDGWPPSAIVLRLLGGKLEVEAKEGVTLDGKPITKPRVAGRNAVIARDGERFQVVTGGAFGDDSTVLGSRAVRGGSEIELEFLPRGGRLFVREGGVERSVYLADKRCDLMALLLQPPEPTRAGELIDDEVLLVRVWGKELKGRTDVNVLVHRTRKDLERAGIEPARIERAQGGGATRFVLEEGTKVVLG